MQESPLEVARRLIAEGKTTDEIRAILDGSIPGQPPLPEDRAGQTSPVASASAPAPPPITYPPLLDTSKLPTMRLPKFGWPLMLLVCLIPVAVLSLDNADRFSDLSHTLLTFGDITGVIGLGMYVLNLLLATRLRWLEDLFGGLNRVLIAHQVLGGLALTMLLVHPMFSAASYYSYGIHVVAHFFIPQLQYLGTAFGIVALIMIIVLLVLSYYIKLGYKIWLKTHKYLGLAYLLIGLHILLTPNRITANPFILWYLYGLFSVGLASFIYRTVLPNIFVRRYLYTISAAEPRGIGAVEVTLIPVDKMVRFKAGQFIFIAFNSDGFSTEWHPFSISSAETSGKLMIDVKSLGGYTETLTRLLPHMTGMTARVEGAYGRFSYRNFDNINQVWIAGGIGITPFLSMAQTLGPGPYNIDLYYSVKTKSELIDLDTLALQQVNRPGQVFRVFPFITDTYNTFLNAEIIANNSGDLTKRDFLLCGPPPMMQAIKKQLIKLGVKERQIHSEEFSLD